MDLQSLGADEVAVVAGVMEGREGMTGEALVGDERAEEMVEAWDEELEDTEPLDFVIEAAPQSPTPSILSSDAAYPPSSDGCIETTNVDDPVAGGDKGKHCAMFGAAGANRSRGFAGQLKRVKGSDDEGGSEHGSIRKWQKRARESDDESSEDCTLSRSAEASWKLKESLKSGTFVIDEGKRERFKKKCRGLDGHAKFRYKGSWQVRHSKCSKWVTMREPYDSVRFGEHIRGCRWMEEKGRNGTIDLFFKPRGGKETGMMRMAQPSARKQIVAGAYAKLRETLIKPDPPSIPFTSNERPCLGLRKDQDERINTYISRVISEGAGSRSDTYATRMLFGDGVKYSELDNTAKRYVAAAQVHLQKWKISHTLGAVFSAECKGKVIVTDETQSSACDQCLGLLKLDIFRKALSVQPPPLESLKFTPHRHRNAASSLGINLAKIEGVSNLLEKVSRGNFHDLGIQN